MLRFLTAGESHGIALTAIIEGLPAGLRLKEEEINDYLQRRQRSYGRGTRMKKIENDRVIITAGMRNGVTIGSPLALQIENKDWLNRTGKQVAIKKIPRPGHADLAGIMKYGFADIQNVIERASARETAIRTAVGAVAALLLREFGIEIIGHTISIGKVKCLPDATLTPEAKQQVLLSRVFCLNRRKSLQMCKEIDKAKKRGDTLGGAFEVTALNIPPGLGSYVHWDRKIDGRLAQAILSIPSVKAMEIGDGFFNASRLGSGAQDWIIKWSGKIGRRTNRAGGIEGGVTNGEPLKIRGYAKPISSLRNPLPSVNLETGIKTKAPYVRSDICVIPAISVIAEAMVAWIVAETFVEKFGGDSIPEIKTNYENYLKSLKTEFHRNGQDAAK